MRVLQTVLLGALLLGTPALAAAPANSNPWANSPGKKEFPDASAIILKDDIGATVNADGSHDLVEYDAIKVLDKNGAERFSHTQRLYDSKTASVEVKLAHVWKADGRSVEVAATQITDTRPEMFAKQPLYARVRQISIDYPDVAEGDVVEFRIVHHGKAPWPAKKFWEVSYTQDFEPILDTAFTVTYPEQMKLETATPGMSAAPPEVTRQMGQVSMRWHLTNRPVVVKQSAMPPLREVATQIQVSNFTSWDDLASWARAMYDTAAAPSNAVQARTASVVAGAANDSARVAQIVAYLAREKPVLSGDLALEELAPCTATDALAAATLLPTDRAVLLLSMLRAAGLSASGALVATADYGKPERGLPSLQQFNRLLVVVNTQSGPIWIDPEADTPQVLGQGLAGQDALLLNNQPARLVKTPLAPPQANREEINGVSRLDPDSSMETTLKVIEYGTNEVVWRTMLAGFPQRGQQQDLFQRLVSGINPGAVLRDFYVEPRDAKSGAPFNLTLSFETTHATTQGEAGSLALSMPLLAQRHLVSYADTPVAKRLYPVSLGATAYEERHMQMVIPSGWKIKSVPHPFNKFNAVGSFQVETRSDERNVWYFSRLILRKPDITVAEYAQFKELMEAVGASTEENITLAAPPAAHIPK